MGQLASIFLGEAELIGSVQLRDVFPGEVSLGVMVPSSGRPVVPFLPDRLCEVVILPLIPSF